MNKKSDPVEPILQAEVGGGARIDPGQGLQRPGYVIRDFTLPDLFGNQVRISDFRGKTNLVLFFLGNSPRNSLAWNLANKRSDFAEQQATLIAILSRVPDAQELGKAF